MDPLALRLLTVDVDVLLALSRPPKWLRVSVITARHIETLENPSGPVCPVLGSRTPLPFLS